MLVPHVIHPLAQGYKAIRENEPPAFRWTTTYNRYKLIRVHLVRDDGGALQGGHGNRRGFIGVLERCALVHWQASPF